MTHSHEAFLMTVVNNIEADLIEAILKNDDIPVLRKYREAGGYLTVFMGDTIYGIDLYVPDKLLDKANELIETSRSASSDEQFPDNVEQDAPVEGLDNAERDKDDNDSSDPKRGDAR